MENTTRAKKEVSVVIIGAGISGLAAAHKLQNFMTNLPCNFKVKVLEAGPKPGGRIQTVNFNGIPSELGARFLYHYKHSTGLTDFAVQKGIAGKLLDNVDELFMDGEMPTVHLMSNGDEIPEQVAIHYKKIIDSLMEEVVTCAQNGDWSYTVDCHWPKDHSVLSEPKNVQEYLLHRFKVAASKTPVTLQQTIESIPECIFQRMITYEQFENGTNDFSNVSIVQYKCYANPEGQFELKTGYGEITNALAHELLPNTIQCNSVVENISWASQSNNISCDVPISPVTVVCKDGTTHNADHVIVTISLGALQDHCRDHSHPFFSPSLNKEKVDAIMKLGMGQGATMLIEFTAPLLDRPHQAIELFWLKEMTEQFEDYKWARNLDILLRVRDSNIYGAWFTGDNASAVEVATKDDLFSGIFKVLEMFVQGPVPHPARVEVSKWIQNPFIRGTYSYYAQGSSESDREVLCEPISGSSPLQILFAGEATHTRLYSTTIGAYESGIREANRLISYYNE